MLLSPIYHTSTPSLFNALSCGTVWLFSSPAVEQLLTDSPLLLAKRLRSWAAITKEKQEQHKETKAFISSKTGIQEKCTHWKQSLRRSTGARVSSLGLHFRRLVGVDEEVVA